MTNNCKFVDLLKYEICNRIWLIANHDQLIQLTFANNRCYNVSIVVFVFSMRNLGRILISNLVVANLLMYSLSGMILLYLAAPSYTKGIFG